MRWRVVCAAGAVPGFYRETFFLRRGGEHFFAKLAPSEGTGCPNFYVQNKAATWHRGCEFNSSNKSKAKVQSLRLATVRNFCVYVQAEFLPNALIFMALGLRNKTQK